VCETAEIVANASPPPDVLPTEAPARHVALTVIAVAVVIVLLQFMQPILVPFVISGLLFYALDPAVDWMERFKVPRVLGAAVMLGLTVGGVAVLAFSLQGQAMTVVDQLPQGAKKFAALFAHRPSDAPGAIDKVQQAADALQAANAGTKAKTAGVVRVQVEDQKFQASSFIWATSMGALSALNQAVMILLLTYFMLLSDQLFKRKLVEIAGQTLSRKKVTVQILGEIAGQIEQFMVIQVVTSLIVALVTWGALWALGLHQAALWGLLAGVLNSIPYYGPLLVTGGLSVVGFLQFGELGRTAAVAGAALLITTLEGSILTPAWMGSTAQMNRIAIFAGLLFWSWVWGVWGMLLAVPMMMAIKVVCDHVEDLKPIGHFLGE
jgi:predicted PurR-regulated permease PerM